jgi:hypothetical protein
MECLKDGGLRVSTYSTLLEQSMEREARCRTDPYFAGATNMYLSGFYGEFRRAVKEARANGNVLAFEPLALGTIDGVMTLILPENEYKGVKKALAPCENAIVKVDPREHGDREYDVITIEPGKNIKVIFYYHIEPKDKRELRHGPGSGPGEIVINFKGENGGTFAFRGLDANGWLN